MLYYSSLTQFKQPLPNYKWLCEGESGSFVADTSVIQPFFFLFFLKKLWNSLNVNSLIRHSAFELQDEIIKLFDICLLLLSREVRVHKVSRGWQVARCIDKISFVQHSNARERYHSSLLEAIYSQDRRCLCLFVSLYLSLSCTQTVKWFALLWLFVYV